MIDRMIRCKDLTANDHIGSLNEWFLKCPPEGKEKHWKDGRSAKETAKHWVYTIPQEFKNILKTFKLNFKMCSPEFVTDFDKNGGNGRNHDLLIIAENEAKETVVISVESKVDEEFDKILSKRIEAAKAELIKRPTSKALKRIEELRFAIFGKTEKESLSLRYQLLTAVAGTLFEAKEQKATKAIFLVQTFKSDEIKTNYHQRNQDDLDAFVNYVSKGKIPKLEAGILSEPITVPGNESIPNNIELWIGKYEIEI